MVDLSELWTPSFFLRAYREDSRILNEPPIVSLIHYCASDGGDSQTGSAEYRLALAKLLFDAFSKADQKLIRLILEQELLCLEKSWGTPYALKASVILLSQLADVEDVPLLWKAKTANFDTFSSIDVQLLVSAGVDRCIDFFRKHEQNYAFTKVEINGEALTPSAYLQRSRDFGDFEDIEDDIKNIIFNFREDLLPPDS